ncbi:MAG: hypothetical protein ACOWWO_12780 [Peptococcaceae bacterium]
MKSEITVLSKTIENDAIKLICRLPCEKLAGIRPFQILEIIAAGLTCWGVVLEVSKKDNSIAVAVKNHFTEAPLKIDPLIAVDDVLEMNKLGRALPPLMLSGQEKILITVDGFWFCLLKPLVDYLKQIPSRDIMIISHFPAKNLNSLASVKAESIIPVENFTSLKQKISQSDADTLICLNTSKLQRKITSFMWSERINKSLIIVNNHWL